MNKYIQPAQRRTIIVKTTYSPHTFEKMCNIYNVNKQFKFKTFLTPLDHGPYYLYYFTLNMPKFQVVWDDPDMRGIRWFIHALNDKDELCHMPLFNIWFNGKICQEASNINGFIAGLYNTKFSTSLYQSISKYNRWITSAGHRIHETSAAMLVLRDWEETGKINLITEK